MLRTAQKKERQILIDPIVYFSPVNPVLRSVADKGTLILYLDCLGEGGCHFNEEKLMRFLKCCKIYRADRHECGSPSPVAESFLTFGQIKKQLTMPVPSKDKQKFSNFLKTADTPTHDRDESDAPAMSVNIGKKKPSHQRCHSDFAAGKEHDSKTQLPVLALICAFSIKGILFELTDNISLQQLVSISPDRRLEDADFVRKQLKLLLRMAKPLTATDGQECAAEWKEFLTLQSELVFKILDFSNKNAKQELLDAYKEFLFQRGLAEMQLDQALKIGSPQANLLRSITSFEGNCESLQTTVKKTTTATQPISDTLESLLIGIFASISNDPSKKETFYCLGIQKYSQLNYNSLLDLTIHFLTNEFSKTFSTNVTNESLMKRLKELNDPVGIETFKHTGDLSKLHSVIFGTQKEISPSSPDQSKKVQCQIKIEKAPSITSLPKSDRKLRVRGSSLHLRPEGGISLKVPHLAIERLPSGSGELLSSSKLSRNEEVFSLDRSRAFPPNESPARPPFKQSTLKDFPRSQEESDSMVDSRNDEQMYASFFEDNWHVLKNDLKDAMLVKTAKIDPHKEGMFAKQIYNFIRDENVAVVIAASQLILRKIDVKAFNQVVKRQSRQSNQFIQSPREKSNKEFHYAVFKGLLSCTASDDIKAYIRNLKYLFLHEDKFVLGAYASAALAAIIQPAGEPQITSVINNLEEDLLLMIRVFQDSKGRFLLGSDKRSSKTQANLDDESIINDPQLGLSEVDKKRLYKIVCFNNSGLLHNLYCRYLRSELDKYQLSKALRTYSTMYEDLKT